MFIIAWLITVALSIFCLNQIWCSFIQRLFADYGYTCQLWDS